MNIFQTTDKSRDDRRWLTAGSRISATKAVVFIHGLGSTATATWGQMLSLCEDDPDFKDFAFFKYEYPTHKTGIRFWKPLPTLVDMAVGLQTEINIRMARFGEIYIVAHSMGGLIARRLIANQLKASGKTNINGALLLATPNSGATLADVASLLFPSQRHTKLLRPYSEALYDLNTDWITSDADAKATVWLVAGGIDQIVSTTSVQGDASRQLDGMLIEYDHFSITKPENRSSSNYLLMKGFLRKPVAQNVSSLGDEAGDPLFEVYRLRHEEFYLTRDSDDLLSVAMSSGGVWITGPSGVGKTAAITRFALIGRRTLIQVYLGSYKGVGADGLLMGIYEEIAESLSREQDRPDLSSPTRIIIGIRAVLRLTERSTKILIVIEEIPLQPSAEYVTFCSYVHMLIESLEAAGLDHVAVACTSIDNPLRSCDHNVAKFRAKMQFISFDRWTFGESHHLTRKLKDALSLSIPSVEIDAFAHAATGLPRFIKALLRNKRSSTASLTAEQLITQTRAEIL